MRTVVIDFSRFGNAKEAHAYLKDTLSFPEYYGANLDALHDVLTEIAEDTEILTAASGAEFAEGFLKVLRDASNENRHLKVRRKPRNRRDGRRHG